MNIFSLCWCLVINSSFIYLNNWHKLNFSSYISVRGLSESCSNTKFWFGELNILIGQIPSKLHFWHKNRIANKSSMVPMICVLSFYLQSKKREKGKTFSIETSQYDMLRKPSEIDKGRLPSNHQASPMLEDLIKSVLLRKALYYLILFA